MHDQETTIWYLTPRKLMLEMLVMLMFMLFGTKQMSTKHKLNEMSNKVMINNNPTLDRVSNLRILGVNFDENLNWENHVTKVIKTCYSTLASLKKDEKAH